MKKPCVECPFSRAIAPGFTGGADPSVYIGQAVWPFLLPCHMDPRYAVERRSLELIQCAGAATFRANIGVAGRMPSALLRCDPDRQAVFATPAELLAHHTGLELVDAEAWLADHPPALLLLRELTKAGVETTPAPRTET